MKHIFDLLGRLFLSFIFFYEAYDSIKFFKDTKVLMTNYGLTWRQDFLLYGAIFCLILGATSILTGYRAKLGTFLLLLYWVPVTFIVHDFWNMPDPQHRIEGIHFMKNMAIIGGLMMVFANGVGKYSIKRLFATSRVRNV
ncbi:DoxX family protein [Lewinella sp. LCG006]|uniref:DoxX family protein n=1 Tax=Lewinella sp. LCG006 TaxID=3231911 RepID=UPI00345F6C2C